MDEDLRKNLQTLAQLQLTDSECSTIRKNLMGVEERINELAEQVTLLEQQVAQERSQLEELKKLYRSDEHEVKTVESGIAKSQEKLHAVKNNKEYQSMLKEIEDLQIKKASIEDRMIDTLERIEAAERQSVTSQADLDDLRREIEEKQAAIRKTAEEQRLELQDCQEERERIWAMLAPKLQKVYARSQQHGNGVAVAAVVNAVCQACRMNIPPQAFIELQRLNSLSLCPHCQRIIYPKAIMEDLR